MRLFSDKSSEKRSQLVKIKEEVPTQKSDSWEEHLKASTVPRSYGSAGFEKQGKLSVSAAPVR